MKILVIGSGGREHVLAWKLAQSSQVTTVYCAPGNDGMTPEAQRVDLGPEDGNGLIRFVKDNHIDLSVVGPEAPLVQGMVDLFRNEGLAVVGPSAAAARLEGSKIFAKDFMSRHQIPTARYEVHESAATAQKSLDADRFSFPVVIKADGLAAGKGVIIAEDGDQAREALNVIMKKRMFGTAGDRVIIEEFLRGEEASFMVFSDGRHVIPMVPSQDHKAAFDGDQGPNTGGMGAYSDDLILTPALKETIMTQVILPTIRGMAEERNPFTGILYAGLMLADDGPQVLEFNVRFGDPETQVVLPRLRTDLADILLSLVDSRLDQVTPVWDPSPAVCVVLASEGYPGSYPKGRLIEGLDDVERLSDVTAFHAGTKRDGNRFVTNGGRVLGVTASGPSLKDTISKTYDAVRHIRFQGMHYRKDIGEKGLKRTS